MIRWLNPAALAGLALVCTPVIIHLLRTHRAERVGFPSLRFVRASQTASVRVRWPSDLVLLALRVALITAAVLAVARPIVLAPSRLRSWNARIARAVVVDTSESMRRGSAGAQTPASAATEAADVEQVRATYGFRIEEGDVHSGLRRALAWIEHAPPARREVVVISDFQRGVLTAADVAEVPASIGLRFVRVGSSEDTRTIPGLTLLSAPGVPGRRQEIAVTSAATAVTVSSKMPDQSDRLQSGLRIEAVEGDVTRLLRAVASSGAPAPSPTQPMAMILSDTLSTPPSVRPIRHHWMLETILRLRADALLAAAGREVHATASMESPAWTTVAADAVGRPIVSAAEAGDELILRVAAPARSFIAAAALRAGLAARHGSTSQPEQEIVKIDAAELAAWTRTPAPVEQEVWRHTPNSDSRWFWLAALMALVLEHFVRRTAGVGKGVRIAA